MNTIKIVTVEMIQCPRCMDGYFMPVPSMLDVFNKCLCSQRCGMIYYEHDLNHTLFQCDIGKFTVQWKDNQETVVLFFNLQQGGNQEVCRINNWISFQIGQERLKNLLPFT